MDHWDLIVAFDAQKHQQEAAAFENAGRVQKMQNFRATLDGQMGEINGLREQEAENRRQERANMLAMVEENKRLKQAEHDAEMAQREEMKQITDDMLRGLEDRRRKAKELKQKQEHQMKTWLENERLRQQEEDRQQAEEHTRKCNQAKAEMQAAMDEAKRRKEEREKAEKLYVAEQQKGMDDKEAANRAAVQARMDQIERNCATLGKEIQGRDARAEQELQDKIRRVQEQADRDSKEDAERRKNETDRKNREMIASLDEQMRQRKEQGLLDKAENEKQAKLFKEDYERGLAKDRAEAEARRQARLAQDKNLIKQMSAQLEVHPRNFGITSATQQMDVAYNRALFEHMHSEGFMSGLTGHMLKNGEHRKIDPFPSVGRFEGPIHPHELQEVDAQIAG